MKSYFTKPDSDFVEENVNDNFSDQQQNIFTRYSVPLASPPLSSVDTLSIYSFPVQQMVSTLLQPLLRLMAASGFLSDETAKDIDRQLQQGSVFTVGNLHHLTTQLEQHRQYFPESWQPLLNNVLEIITLTQNFYSLSKDNNEYFLKRYSEFLDKCTTLLSSTAFNSLFPPVTLSLLEQGVNHAKNLQGLLQLLQSSESSTEKWLKELKKSNILPDWLISLFEMISHIVKLHQIIPVNLRDNWITWIENLMQNEETSSLLSQYLPADWRITGHELHLQLQQISNFPVHDSWAAQFSWLTENSNLLPEKISLLFNSSSNSPRISLFLSLAEKTIKHLQSRPEKITDSRTEILPLLMEIITDKNTLDLLRPLIPTSFTESINSAQPLLQNLSTFPASATLREQITWLVDALRNPESAINNVLPEKSLTFLQQQLTSYYSDSGSKQLAEALLSLFDSQLTSWQKMKKLIPILFNNINLRHAIYSGTHTLTTASSYGIFGPAGVITGMAVKLPLEIWEWYQTQPAGQTWSQLTSKFIRWSVQIDTRFLPTNTLSERMRKIAVTLLQNLPPTLSWKDSTNWLSNAALQGIPELRWFTEGYRALSLIYGLQQGLNMPPQQQGAAFENIAQQLQQWLRPEKGTITDTLIDLLPTLAQHRSLYGELKALHTTNSWLEWNAGLLDILENHFSPRLLSLRHRLETLLKEKLESMFFSGTSELMQHLIVSPLERQISQWRQTLTSSREQDIILLPELESDSENLLPHVTKKEPNFTQHSRSQQRYYGHKHRSRHLKNRLRRQKAKHKRLMARQKHRSRQHVSLRETQNGSYPVQPPRADNLRLFPKLRTAALIMTGLYLASQLTGASARESDVFTVENDPNIGNDNQTHATSNDKSAATSSGMLQTAGEATALAGMWLAIAYFSWKNLHNDSSARQEEEARLNDTELTDFSDHSATILLGDAPAASAISQTRAMRKRSWSRYLIPALLMLGGGVTTAYWLCNKLKRADTVPEPVAPDLNERLEITPAVAIYLQSQLKQYQEEKSNITLPDKNDIARIINFFNKKNSHLSNTESDNQAVSEFQEATLSQPLIAKRSLASVDDNHEILLSDEIKFFIKEHWNNGELNLSPSQQTQVTYDKKLRLYKVAHYYLLKIDQKYWQVLQEYSEPGSQPVGTLVNSQTRAKIPLTLDDQGVWGINKHDKNIQNMQNFIDNLLSWEEYNPALKQSFQKLLSNYFLSTFGKDVNDTIKGALKEIYNLIDALLAKNNSDPYMITPLLKMKFEILEKINLNDVDIFFDIEASKEPLASMDFIARAMRVHNINEEIYVESLANYLFQDDSYHHTYNLINDEQKELLDTEKLYKSRIAQNKQALADTQKNIKLMQDKIKQIPFNTLNEYALYKKREELKSLQKQEKNLLEDSETKKILKLLPLISEKISSLEAKKSQVRSILNKKLKLHDHYYLGLKLAHEDLQKKAPELISYTGKEINLKKAAFTYLDFVGDEINTYKKYAGSPNEEFIEDNNAQQAAKKYISDLIGLQKSVDFLKSFISVKLSDIAWHNDYRDIITVNKYAEQLLPADEKTLIRLSSIEPLNEHKDIEAYRKTLAIMLYYLKKNNKDISELRYASYQVMLKTFTEDEKRLNIFSTVNNKKPAGYYSFTDFMERKKFSSQYDYNEQFNIYRDNFLGYDARQAAIEFARKDGLPISVLLSPVRQFNYFRVEDKSDTTYISDTQPTMSGRVCAIQMANEDWIIMAYLSNKLQIKKYHKQDINNDKTLKVLTEPNKYTGKKNIMTNDGHTFSTQENYYPYDNNSRNGEPLSTDEKLDYEIFWNDFFETNIDAPLLEYLVDHKDILQQGKNSFELLTNCLRISLDNLSRDYQNQLDQSGFWHQAAKVVIPFYDVIYRAATDSHFSVSAEDVISIAFDSLSLLTIIGHAGVELAALTEKMVKDLTIKVAAYRSIGFTSKQTLAAIAGELPSILGKVYLPESAALLTKMLIELVDPFPLPTAAIIKNGYRYINSKISNAMQRIANDATILNNRVIVPTPDSTRTGRINESLALPDNSVDISETKYHQENNRFKGIYEKKTSTGNPDDKEYFIQQDNKLYQVRWDEYSYTWRLINPQHPGKFYYAVPVMLVDNRWITHSRLPGLGGGRSSAAHYSGNYRQYSIENTRLRKLLINVSKSRSRTKSFKPDKNKFATDKSFSVIPVGTELYGKSYAISKKQMVIALQQMEYEGENLQAWLRNYSGADKAALQEKINLASSFSQNAKTTLIEESTDPTDSLLSLFALIKKNGTNRATAREVYGFISLDYNTEEKLTVRYLAAHPFAIANASPEFRNYLIDNHLLTAEQLDPYRIKSVSSHLVYSSIKRTVDFYEARGMQVKVIETETVSPVTDRLATRLQNELQSLLLPDTSSQQRNYFAMRGIRQDSRGRNVAGASASSAPLPVNTTSFRPLKAREFLSPEDARELLVDELAGDGYIIVSEKLSKAKKSDRQDLVQFSKEIETAAEQASNIYHNINTAFKLAENDTQLREDLSEFLKEATGLNDKISEERIPDYARNTLPDEQLSSQVYERFKAIVSTGDEYMQQLSKKKYKNIGIIEEVGIPDRRTGELQKQGKLYGVVHPKDPQLRIYVALPNEKQIPMSLTSTLLHESTHAAFGTEDFSYLADVRMKEGRFPLAAEYRIRKTENFIHEQHQLLNITNFIMETDLSLNDLYKSHGQRWMAHPAIVQAGLLMEHNKLIRANVFLHTAEFDTLLLEELAQRLHFNDARTHAELKPAAHPRNRRSAASKTVQLQAKNDIIRMSLISAVMKIATHS